MQCGLRRYIIFRQNVQTCILCSRQSYQLREWVSLGFCFQIINYQTNDYFLLLALNSAPSSKCLLVYINFNYNKELEGTHESLIKYGGSFGRKHSLIWPWTVFVCVFPLCSAIDFCGREIRTLTLRHARSWSS